MLRKNQLNAINTSINNDFESGIHYHATGTGKSWIGIKIVEEFNKKYPKKNILWICERKDILVQQFSNKTLKERNFEEIIKKFNVLNFVEKKVDKWYESLNCAHFWGKPFLCIINRCFLTTKLKYKNIKSQIDLIIHDECHTIENNSSNEFYEWYINKCKHPRIIGFSATPEKIYPLDKILTKYNIYDAYLDNVILPPKVIWIKGDHQIENNLVELIKDEIEKLPHKKIIIWSGIIQECIDLAEKWEKHFEGFDICMDFNSNISDKYKSFDYFFNKPNNTILFCAVKHREGSDIPNIDGCIFMDLVDQRSERVFIQSMGRVLRKDKENKKKYGLIIDVKAKSTINICNRVQKYLQLNNIFPWKYSNKKITIRNKIYFVNYLDMIESTFLENTKLNKTYVKNDVSNRFVRLLPNMSSYKKRLDYELDLVFSKNLYGNIVKALEILEITKNIPHITRGSCGSSLLCYLLGISHVDPIRYKISFARFLNRYRDNLPDIDFDFPHYLRDEVFLKLFQKWGNKVARISNHNYFHEKSALREALRIHGINKFISKYEIDREIKSYPTDLQNKIEKTKKELEGKFKGYSLHCGGIIYFPEGIPKEHVLENSNSILQQINYNKEDVAENKNFKIDILSSCGLSQLYCCVDFQDINFNSHIGDPKTIELLSTGNNIGITLAETPLMRKALRLIKPKTIMDLAICLSIIRPAAKDAKKEYEMGKYNRKSMVFDDDVIYILSKIMDCNEELADFYRRKYTKQDSEIVNVINRHLCNKDSSTRNKLKEVLDNLRKYGFCKAHALSYSQLVWQLAYQKAHFPEKFWKATLKNVNSCYRKWVHIYEARCNNVYYEKKNSSIYSSRKKQTANDNLESIKKYGYWNMISDDFFEDCYLFQSNGMYIFKGLIAASRLLKFGRLILFIGVKKGVYIEIIIIGKTYFDNRKTIVKGKGFLDNQLYKTIKCDSKNIKYI